MGWESVGEKGSGRLCIAVTASWFALMKAVAVVSEGKGRGKKVGGRPDHGSTCRVR